MPLIATDSLTKRMKSVALEREKIRQRERERLARGERISLRRSPKQYMQTVVDRFNLNKWVGQEEARALLVQAGYRGQAPYITFLFFRLVMPAVMLIVSLFYVFIVIELDQPAVIKLGLCIGATYAGMHLPVLFLKNKITRRQLSIRRAFPDALDLLLICVESGMSIETGFKRVAEEIGTQSIPLTEELTLTTAELSYLQDPRQAYENLAKRNQSRRSEIGVHGVATGRALWNAHGANAARDGAGEPRHAHVGGGEKGGGPAAEAHCSDDPVLSAGPVHRDSRTRRHQGDGDHEVSA